MSDQQFVLRWHYHETTLIYNLPCFLESDILTDVTLSVGTQQVKAHKIILAMCSVYFLQLFQEIKSAHPVVILHNVSFKEVQAILSFMYRGQCVVSQRELPSLLSVARLLKIQGLCDMKVPDRQTRSDFATNESEHFDKMPKIKELYNSYDDDNEVNFRDQLLRMENMDKKRQIDNSIAVQDSSSDRAHRISSYFDDETALGTKKFISIKNFDEPCSIAKKIPTKDNSETCKCFLCGKYLSNQYNLRVHMETHEEAFHACQSCPHVSRSRDALRKHVSYRHPEEYQIRKRKKGANS